MLFPIRCEGVHRRVPLGERMPGVPPPPPFDIEFPRVMEDVRSRSRVWYANAVGDVGVREESDRSILELCWCVVRPEGSEGNYGDGLEQHQPSKSGSRSWVPPRRPGVVECKDEWWADEVPSSPCGRRYPNHLRTTSTTAQPVHTYRSSGKRQPPILHDRSDASCI